VSDGELAEYPITLLLAVHHGQLLVQRISGE
jgi:hypothetical protein